MTIRVLLLPVGLDLYAVPIESVREVVPSPLLCPLPTAQAAVLGLFNLRGEIVPLLDPSVLIGVGLLSAWAFAIVLHTDMGPAGLAASSLPESVLLDEPVGASESHGTAGVYAVGRRIAALIDVEALLNEASITGQVAVGSGRREPR